MDKIFFLLIIPINIILFLYLYKNFLYTNNINGDSIIYRFADLYDLRGGIWSASTVTVPGPTEICVTELTLTGMSDLLFGVTPTSDLVSGTVTISNAA